MGSILRDGTHNLVKRVFLVHNCISQITSQNIFSGIFVVYQAPWIVIYPVDSVIHLFNNQAAVVQTLDSAIHRIKIYPMDSAIGFPNTYPLDSDLSGPGCSKHG